LYYLNTKYLDSFGGSVPQITKLIDVNLLALLLRPSGGDIPLPYGFEELPLLGVLL
jgi:hypothetical protein